MKNLTMPEDQLQGTKSIFLSKSFWGTVLAAAPAVISVATGIDASREFGTVVDHGVPLVGAVLSIVGIFTRKQRISLTGAPKF